MSTCFTYISSDPYGFQPLIAVINPIIVSLQDCNNSVTFCFLYPCLLYKTYTLCIGYCWTLLNIIDIEKSDAIHGIICGARISVL